jgi:hypothetical protein
VLDTTLRDKVCPVFTSNKIDHYDIAEILLKVVLNTITPTFIMSFLIFWGISLTCICCTRRIARQHIVPLPTAGVYIIDILLGEIPVVEGGQLQLRQPIASIPTQFISQVDTSKGGHPPEPWPPEL